MNNVLSMESICFGYSSSGELIFKDFNINIPEGCVTAILGANGSGKTTLLHLFLGLLTPLKGKIYYFNEPRSLYPNKKIKKMIGLVPQSETIPFDLNVMEYVLLGRAPFLNFIQPPGKKDREIAEKAIEAVGIDHIHNRSVPSLSGGEKQLASVARALAQEPAVMLLDEPIAHLDISNSKRILKVMKKIGRQNKSVVFTTHDPNAAVAIADHVILLRSGILITKGSCKDTITEDFLNITYREKIRVIHTHDRPMVIPW